MISLSIYPIHSLVDCRVGKSYLLTVHTSMYLCMDILLISYFIGGREGGDLSIDLSIYLSVYLEYEDICVCMDVRNWVGLVWFGFSSELLCFALDVGGV